MPGLDQSNDAIAPATAVPGSALEGLPTTTKPVEEEVVGTQSSHAVPRPTSDSGKNAIETTGNINRVLMDMTNILRSVAESSEHQEEIRELLHNRMLAEERKKTKTASFEPVDKQTERDRYSSDQEDSSSDEGELYYPKRPPPREIDEAFEEGVPRFRRVPKNKQTRKSRKVENHRGEARGTDEIDYEVCPVSVAYTIYKSAFETKCTTFLPLGLDGSEATFPQVLLFVPRITFEGSELNAFLFLPPVVLRSTQSRVSLISR